MTPILIFLPLFCSLVLVIKSLRSMLFSLEYKIPLLKMFKFGKYMLNKTKNSIELSLLNIYSKKGANSKMLGESTIAIFFISDTGPSFFYDLFSDKTDLRQP